MCRLHICTQLKQRFLPNVHNLAGYGGACMVYYGHAGSSLVSRYAGRGYDGSLSGVVASGSLFF